jgi:retron-type reverse transcriptase
MSVESGIYPDKLKHAKVIPIFKNDRETDPSNYRPISLLSIFNRIFEKVMYERLKKFLEKYNILYENQYGFREKRSTQHAIIDIVNQIQTNMDKNMYACGIFIDLQKAFDTVNHSILLQKLQHYGIRGIINDWFSSYLLNRIQTTQIGTVVSDKETMLSGVPQRSVLGPLLFLIYLNDIYNSTDKLNFSLFADETNLLYADNDLSLVLGNNC